MSNILDKLVKLKLEVENNEALKGRTNVELAFLARVLDDNELPIKDFDCYSITTDGEKMPGTLLLTEKRAVFMGSTGDKIFGDFPYAEIEQFIAGVNERKKSEGVFVIVMGGLFYSFSGLMRFGLSQWEDYVSAKLKETDIDKD